MQELIGTEASIAVSAVAMLILFALGTSLLVSAVFGRRRLPAFVRFNERFYALGTGGRWFWIGVALLVSLMAEALVVLLLVAGPNTTVERAVLVGEMVAAALWLVVLAVSAARTAERPY
jgi:hypothetical protein